PVRYIDQFADAGSDMITFHVEACEDAEAVITKIKRKNKKVGITVKPGTDISDVYGYLDKVDMVLIMTVEPGFGGQFFMKEMLEKVRKTRERFSGYIQVDGGINKDTAAAALEAGADVLVAGTAVFGRGDYSRAISELKGEFTP
ncbi:MAG: ribulose-phosphate 3-epimerase, partial [Candidatus Omnitrophota bacterium]